MILFTLITFSAIVILIAIVTHRLNTHAPCNHEWQETEAGLRCNKCNRTITRQDKYASHDVPLVPTGQVYINPNRAGIMHQHDLDLHNFQED